MSEFNIVKRSLKKAVGASLLLLAGGMALGVFAHARKFDTAALSGPAASSAVAAASPFIETHAHLDQKDTSGSIQAALKAMPSENAARIIFLPSPFTPDDPT